MPINPANASKNYAWNGIIVYPLLPETGGTVNSERMIVPRGADTMTIHVPNFTGTPTVTLRTLAPQVAADGSESWTTIKVLQLEAAADAYPAIDSIPEGAAGPPVVGAVVLYKSAFGCGILRLVTSSDVSSAPVRVSVVFGF